jgi:hypothetical protein
VGLEGVTVGSALHNVYFFPLLSSHVEKKTGMSYIETIIRYMGLFIFHHGDTEEIVCFYLVKTMGGQSHANPKH